MLKSPHSPKFRIAHSPKGWTDGTISSEWIKDFDEKTRTKANGRARLLLVDGHNSHYTLEFLDYARQHNIHVLCYPAHSTHVYQGLDVVIFSPLKRFWTQERDQFESSKRQKITKSNFISIYSRAHCRALTPENIRAAFKKTGVWPFNPNVITEEAMAPSIESSSNGSLPLPQPSPVRALTQAIHQYQQHCKSLSQSNNQSAPTVSPTATATQLPLTSIAEKVVAELSSTSVAFLVSEKPVESSDQLPCLPNANVSLSNKRKHILLETKPKTDCERELQQALSNSYTREQGIQATMVLQKMYCDRVQQQLQGQEKKKNTTKGGHLVGDGLPILLTGESFHSHVVEHRRITQEEAIAQDARRVAREERAEAMKVWKELEMERVKRNQDRRALHKEEIKQWEEERDQAKAEKRSWSKTKPKLGKLEGPALKPTLNGDNDNDNGDGGDEVPDSEN